MTWYVALAHIKYTAQVVEDIHMTTDFKLQTRDMLVSCLENHAYADTALFDFADQLLDIEDDENSEEAESLAWLMSQYANYLDPRHCDPKFLLTVICALKHSRVSLRKSGEKALRPVYRKIRFEIYLRSASF